MKTTKIPGLSTLVLSLFMIISCSKATEARSPVQKKEPSRGLIVVQGAPFYRGEDVSSLEWAAALDLGTTCEATGPESNQVVGGESLSLRPVTLSSDASAPSGDGARAGWVRASQFLSANYEAAAVLTENARTYSSEGAANEALLPRLAFVFIDRPSKSGHLFKARTYDEVSGALLSLMVSEEDVTFERDDVRVAALIAKARKARDEGERRAILEDAERTFGASVFAPDIRSMLGAGPEEDAEDPSSELEDLAATFTVGSDEAKVVAEPVFDAPVVATLRMDDEVSVVARTVLPSASEENEARWYKITAPAEGWIFGADLEGAD